MSTFWMQPGQMQLDTGSGSQGRSQWDAIGTGIQYLLAATKADAIRYGLGKPRLEPVMRGREGIQYLLDAAKADAIAYGFGG